MAADTVVGVPTTSQEKSQRERARELGAQAEALPHVDGKPTSSSMAESALTVRV